MNRVSCTEDEAVESTTHDEINLRHVGHARHGKDNTQGRKQQENGMNYELLIQYSTNANKSIHKQRLV